MTQRLRLPVLFTLALAVFTTALVSGAAGTFAIGSWTAIEPSLESRSGAAAAQLPDGSVLVTGGDTGSGATNSSEIYDVMSGTWTSADALLDARAGHTITALKDGRVAIVGGAASGAALRSIEIADPSTGERRMGPSLMTARRDHGAALLPDGRLLIVGGTDGSNALTSTEIVDLESGEVAPGPELPQPRTGVTASALLDGRVLIAGGNNGEQDLASTLIYNPGSGSLTAGASLTSARSGHTAAVLPNNNSVLIAGGKSGDAQLSSAELYVYWQNASKATGAMSAARVGAAAAGTGAEGVAIIAGGNGNSAEAYGFATLKTDKDDYAPGTRVYVTGSGWEPGETVTLTLSEVGTGHADRIFSAVANSAGAIANSDFVPDLIHDGVRFYLTAKGSRSQAHVTFTDRNPGSLTVGAQSPDPVTAGGSASYTVNVLFGGNTDPCTITLSVSGLPTGATGSFSPDNLPSASTPNGAITVNRTLNISTTASGPDTTPAGPHTFTVTGTRGSGCQGSGNITGTGTLTVAAADSTAPTVTAIARSAASPTAVASVSWSVTFSESVTGVNAADFALANTGLGGTPAITGVSGTGSSYTVTASTGTGSGTLGLNLVDDDSIADSAGNQLGGSGLGNGSFTGEVYTIDRTAPDTTITANPATSTNSSSASFSFTSSEVGSTFECKLDAGSFAACTSPQAYTSLTDGSHTFQVRAIDGLGNIDATPASFTWTVDTTDPVITGVRLTAANGNGWNNTSVDVQFTCADEAGGSGIVSSPTTQTITVSAEGQNQTATSTLTCTDAAGNSAAAASVTGISIDKTVPTISAQRDTPANTFGWNNTDVASSYTASDTLSGLVEAATGTFTFTSEGADQTHTFTVHDKAGNSASATVSNVDIDKTKPTASATPTPSPNANGWNKTDVTVGFDGTDALSGIDTCSDDVTLTTETSGTPVSGTCTDKAGNTSDPSSVTVKIDKTAPSISGSRNPLPNLNGWNNSDVTVSFTCGDALSGLAAGSPPAATIVGQGAGQSVSGTCYDQAGNSASDTVANINVDKTAPSVAVTGVTDGATYTLGSVPAAGCSTTDGLSGVNTSATLNLTGGVPPGVGSFTAACNGATDNAGNTANASVTYSVYFGFAGLFQPWESWTDRGFKVKSSIPLKWQYLDSNGVPVDSSLAQPAISIKYLGSCGIGGLDDVVAVQDPGASGLTYDPLTKMWHFNWKTTGLAAGCYNVFIKSNASGQTTGPFTTQLVR